MEVCSRSLFGENSTFNGIFGKSFHFTEKSPVISGGLETKNSDIMIPLLVVLSNVLLGYILLLIFLKRRHKESSNDEYLGLDAVPTLQPLFPIKFIGNVPLLLPLTTILKKGVKWANETSEYGDIIKFHGVNEIFVLMNSPQLVQTLLTSSEPGHLLKSALVYDTMKPFITNGVLVSKHALWQKERKILLRSQSFRSLKGYMGMLNKHSKRFVNDLEKLFEDGQMHEVNTLINTLFIKVISEMITGWDTAAEECSIEFDKYHHNFEIWKESLAKRISNPWLLWRPIWKLHPMCKKHDAALADMMDFARRRIREHDEKQRKIRTLQETGNNNDAEASSLPFRSVLDALRDAGVDEDQMVDEVNTMLFGGHDTGAAIIHFFFLCMGLNHKIQEECRKEIIETFNDPNNTNDSGELKFEVVQGSLKYLERCIQETMRLYPPVFIFLRQITAPLRLECRDGKKIELPPGTTVTVVPFTMHRKEEHFPNAEKFDPDRFLPEEIAKRHPYSYIPFSAGPRNCLGLKFAMLEMKIVAANVLRQFEITTPDKSEDVVLMPFITLTPSKDFRFCFKKIPVL